MKNKNLLLTIVALVAVVVGGIFLTNQKNDKKPQVEGETVRVGVLQFVTHEALDEIYRGIQDGLAEEGYKGDKIKIDFMNAEGDQGKIATMSKQLVSNGNQVLVGIATPAAQGLANATSDLPVVMGAITDPVGAKLVKSLEQPGANVTGVACPEPIAQQLDLIKKMMPNAKTLGVLYSSNEDNSKLNVERFTELAEKEGYTVLAYPVPSSNEIAATMSVMTSKVDAIWIPQDNTIASAFKTVVASNKEAKVPIFPSADTMVKEGGLASVVVSQHGLGISTGKMVAKILKGAKPAETSVDVVDQGTPIINKKVAAELGITIPEDVEKAAGEIVE
ncbi:tryptophan ABC transporter substrate-binding protein [Streptococcus cuniculi]|uniref:ABC transporter substrate-binding protein n=1 Tax=Streptococcus cuniculi TaxID=1432788 RepID=A0A4Y9J8J7_9STRE|nr:tryptophan ABC transporter substrate-binding protein [Streptococcus cuniculi]MBF0778953.1 ABC transporter substrate-binding protein [Streptococcus cuniculi]TFU97107.1 ABC transporter substrate-binding protein [Streptococcus cuniculi]